MHQRAAGGRRTRRLGQPVDDPEPVQQRAGHEVARPRRRDRRCPRLAVVRCRDSVIQARRVLGHCLRVAHVWERRVGLRQSRGFARLRCTRLDVRSALGSAPPGLAPAGPAARALASHPSSRNIVSVAGMTPEQPTPQRDPQPGIVIARPFGIPVYISPYWFLIAGLFIVLYANSLEQSVQGGLRYVVSAAFVILLYASVLVHELSHCVVARAFGLPVRRILLYPLGGFSEIEKEAQTPAREFLVSAAGPGALARPRRSRVRACPGGHRGHLHGARAGRPGDVRQPAGRPVQPAAGPAAGRRPDAARRNLEGHPPPGHRHRWGRPGPAASSPPPC